MAARRGRRPPMTRLFTDPVEVERSTVTSRDRLGNDVREWTVVSPAELLGLLQSLARSQSGEELLDARDTVVEQWILYLPKGSDLRARDRVRVSGVLYDVDGQVDTTNVSPLTGVGYVSAVLRRVTDG